MDLRDVGTPAQLWSRWVLLAAAAAGYEGGSGGAPDYEIRRTDGCAHLGRDEAWVRLRRLGGNRAVLWGHHPGHPIAADFGDEVADLAPDWSYEADSGFVRREVGLLAWHAHGSWGSVPQPVPAPFGSLLEDLASDDAALGRCAAYWPGAERETLSAALAAPDATTLGVLMGPDAAARAQRQVTLGSAWRVRRLSPTATNHLRSQIHLQMRTSGELGGRGHSARPRLLRQWARVQQVSGSFRHAVSALGTTPGFVAGADNAGLTEAQVRSLENVLMELRMAETDESSGAWLFARVVGDAGAVRVERAFDCWPAWYVAPGPGPLMATLHAEMVQRTPGWRPPWSSLLPAERF